MLLRTCVALIVLSAGNAGATAFDRVSFDALPPERKLDVVIGLLEWREQELKNFYYDVEETVRHDGVLVRRSKIEFRRKGSIEFVHCDRLQNSINLPHSEFWIRWDGVVQKSLTEKNGTRRGMIANGQSSFFAQTYFNDIVGVRFADFRLSRTVPQWLKSYTIDAKKPVPFRIETTVIDKHVVIKVRVDILPNHWEAFYLDTDRQYMIVRHEMEHFYSRFNDKSYVDCMVTGAATKGGLWVPMDMLRVSTQFVSKGVKDEYVYHVRSFDRNNVSDSDIALGFPVGTEVVDAVEKTNYVVEENGQLRRKPYYDAPTGQVFGPDDRRIPTQRAMPATQAATQPAR